MSRSKPKKDTPPAPEPLWSARATGGGRGTHLGVKWTLTVVMMLALLVTVIRGFRPVNQTIVNQASTQGVSTVGEYAAAFVRDWYTWTDGKTAERTTRLSVYNPKLAYSGWNGTGSQTVTDARVFAQQSLANDQYRVTVRVTVSTSPAAFYVDVLAVDHNGALGVASIPSLVSGPALAGVDVPGPGTLEQDQDVVQALNNQLNLFFAAYATGDPSLNALVKSGETIVPLGGGVTFKSLDNLSVPALYKGADTSQRTVTAHVTWLMPNGLSTATAAYQVSMVQQAGKWFVSAITGAVPDAQIAVKDSSVPNGPSPTATSTVVGAGSSASRTGQASTSGTGGTPVTAPSSPTSGAPSAPTPTPTPTGGD